MINDQKNFARDKNSRAIINTNRKAHEQYKRMKAQNNKVKQIEDNIAELKKDMSELKSLLIQMVRN